MVSKQRLLHRPSGFILSGRRQSNAKVVARIAVVQPIEPIACSGKKPPLPSCSEHCRDTGNTQEKGFLRKPEKYRQEPKERCACKMRVLPVNAA